MVNDTPMPGLLGTPLCIVFLSLKPKGVRSPLVLRIDIDLFLCPCTTNHNSRPIERGTTRKGPHLPLWLTMAGLGLACPSTRDSLDL